MSGPGPGPGSAPGDRFYQRGSNNNSNTNYPSHPTYPNYPNSSLNSIHSNNTSLYPQPLNLNAIPARKPVGGIAMTIRSGSSSIHTNNSGAAYHHVSPPESTYSGRPGRANSTSQSQSRVPHRMGTFSSGGRFTVSPASSIHEDHDDDDDDAGRGGFLPSPTRHHMQGMHWRGSSAGSGNGRGVGVRHGRQGQGQGQIPGPVPSALVPGPGLIQPTTVIPSGRPGPEPQPQSGPGLGPGPGPALVSGNTANAITGSIWQSQPDETDIPHPAPAQWRGSRDLQELNDARARETESGRWPVRTSYGPAPPTATTTTTAAAVAAALPPLPPSATASVTSPWQQQTPRNESQIDPIIPMGISATDTFPPIPAGFPDRGEARRSWDRQRKQRKAKRAQAQAQTHTMAVVAAVLKAYDGRGLADWPLTVSLNTVIAFLVAICEVALAVPLTEGLSQLKWNSFARGERPLADFGVFEDAKRGPVGSAMLLCRRKGRCVKYPSPLFPYLPTLGVVILCARGRARVCVTTSDSTPTYLPETLDAREKRAIQSGIYHAVDTEVPPLQPLCSSGDCQWASFSSLAVCAAVADVSDRLAVSHQTEARSLGVSLGKANNSPIHAARLPNDLFLVGSHSSCNLNISWPASASSLKGIRDNTGSAGGGTFLPVKTSLAFPDQDAKLSSAIANFFVVYTNQTAASTPALQTTAFGAAEVLLHFCVNTYEASTSRGVSTSKVVHSSALAAEDVSGSSPVSARDTSSDVDRVVLRSASTSTTYSVNREDVRLLNAYIKSLFSGVYSQQHGKAIGGESATSEALGLAMFRRGTTMNDLSPIRAMGSASESGAVFTTESYVHIQWAWLTFLAIQVALGVSFLLGIMVQTAVWNVKILKGSSTAALFAIPADKKAYLEEHENMSLDMDWGSRGSQKLKTITCRFRPQERGWSLEADKREDG
ncbi:uncharacterized protein C8A04DRAFT_13703 [Dichotomopilus funicola]|uniref:Transmembrane protein n=1 Tax=Dichotomopilus funicola TaxID=1934379 RepID=A0AAN6UZW8_9PEZI|nr:hypothetical protein C8A04DRAFT_13703 [Dichotomopilus funicola]